jgi:predicted ribosome quality control (RQC) complex YloA/Tae2 family protein
VTLTNYYDGKEVTIPLDVRLSPSANAQKYFKEYKKKQTAARMLTELIAESDAEAEYWLRCNTRWRRPRARPRWRRSAPS